MGLKDIFERPSFAPIEEAQADEHIWTDPEAARTLLDQGIERTLAEPVIDRDHYHKLTLKRAVLPLYELAAKGISDERIDRAFDVYGELAELLARELLYFQNCTDEIQRRKSRGRVSEITVQCLAARDLQHEDPAIVLLPATQEEDVFSTESVLRQQEENPSFKFISKSKTSNLGTDYHLMSIKDKGNVIYPIQLKTFLTKKGGLRYRKPINTIGLNQIDPDHCSDQTHPDSISSMMLRELNGEGNEEEAHALNMAIMAFYNRVSQQSVAGFVEHPTKTGWLKLSA